MKKLTQRQAMVLGFIIDSLEDHGYPPTIREIGEHMNISSTNGVNDHLKALERKGYLARDQSKSRALRPVCYPDGHLYDPTPATEIVNVPVMGRIAAGNPIEAIEHAEDMITIGEGLLGQHKELFALNVKGDSMIEDGILDGDVLFVSRQQTAERGAIVAVLVDNEATVKRIFFEKNRIRLQPSNASMEPIYINRDEFLDTQILGRVVGVFRTIR